MKFSLFGHIAFAFLTSGSASAATCSFTGAEQKLIVAVKKQLTQDILDLRTKGINVAASSIKFAIAEFGSDKRGLALSVRGGFKSVDGTPFTLDIDGDLRGDGGVIEIPTEDDLIFYYATLQADSFDPEGNPVNGSCHLSGMNTAVIRNTRTRVTVGMIDFLTDFLISGRKVSSLSTARWINVNSLMPADDGLCESNGDCNGGSCTGAGVCQNGGSGAPCDQNSQCASGYCYASGTCR